jgi:predicted GNAT superfamily acetyltransferase
MPITVVIRNVTTVRLLDGLADATAVCRLFAGIWDVPENEGPIDVSMVVALAHSDCYVAGAYDGDQLIGASVGFIGGRRRELLHSHVTGIRDDRTSAGVGYALKQHQRAWALERGLTAITWTFDPLIARNAYFNLTRLGGRLTEYLVDFYGPMTDGRNLGQPSDRALVRWELSDPLADSQARGTTARETLAVLDIRADGGPRWQPEILRNRPVELIIPTDIEGVRRRDPDLALHWRMALRDAMTGLLRAGWTVSGFRRPGGYLLTPPERRTADVDR